MLPSKPTWKTKSNIPRIFKQTRYYFRMRDIQNRADLEVLLHSFYEKLLQDPAIDYIFVTVAVRYGKAPSPDCKFLGGKSFSFWEL